MRLKWILGCSLSVSLFGPSASAGVGSKVVQEAMEFTARKFGREVAEEGVETLARKMTKLAARHGDDVVAAAFKKVGPRAGRVVSEAGEHSGTALKLLAKHGDGALSLVSRKGSLKAVARFGDEAASAILKHGSVGETLIENFGKPAAGALAKVTPQNGRRLAMLSADGLLKPDLMDVVVRHGDTACDFIWRHKGSLAVGAGLATFLASPEEYLRGAKDLTAVVADAAVKPLAAVPGAVAAEAARQINWNLVVVVLGVLAASCLAAWRSRAASVLHRLKRRWLQLLSVKEVRHDA